MNDEARANKDTNVFISYSRKDTGFVQKLHAGIAAAGYDTWVDWEGIELTTDWWHEIQKGIEDADAFAFVISPDSLTSKICYDEIQWAVNNNKRLIPILHREPEEGNELHPKIASHNWVFMRDEAELAANLPQMLKVINTDLEWVQNHTRFQKRALEWEVNSKSDSFCLHGEDLTAAEAWLARGSQQTEQQPTELQIEFIQASRQDETRRQRIIRIATGSALIVFAILFVIAVFQFLGARQSEQEARAAKETAVAEQAIAETERARAETSEQRAEAEAANAVEAEETAVAAAATSEYNEEIAQTREAEANDARNEAEIAVTAESIALLEADEEREKAEVARQDAVEKAHVAQSQLLALDSLSAANEKPMLALLLAIEAGDLKDTPLAFDALNEQLTHMARPIELIEHEAPIVEAMWNRDGTSLLIGTSDSIIQIWNSDYGGLTSNLKDTPLEDVSTIPGNQLNTSKISWNQNGYLVWISGSDNTSRIWNAVTEDLLHTFSNQNGFADAGWSEDGNLFFTISGEGDIDFWDLTTESILQTFDHTEKILHATLNPDASLLLTVSEDGNVFVWNLASEKLVQVLPRENFFRSATWNEGGNQILTTNSDGRIQEWDEATGTIMREIIQQKGVNYAVWSQDQNQILSSSDDGVAQVWNASSGELESILSHEDEITIVNWGPNDEQILTAGGDGIVRIWEGISASLLPEFHHDSQVNSAQWSKDEKRILTSSADGTARIWNKETNELERVFQHDNSVNVANWNFDESQILTASDDFRAYIWDGLNGELLNSLEHDDVVNFAVWNGTSNKVLTGSNDGKARIWDAHSGELLLVLSHQSAINTAVWNQAESHILTSSDDGNVIIWNAINGEQLSTINFMVPVKSAKWDSSQEKVLAILENRTIDVWFPPNSAGHDPIFYPDHIWNANWSQDGTQMLISSGDIDAHGNAKVWGESNLLILEDEAPITNAQWSQDEKQILTSHQDGFVKVWNVDDISQPIFTLNGDGSPITVAKWNKDETQILLSTEEGLTKIYYMRMSELLDIACKASSRNLSPEEWDLYLSTQEYDPFCPNWPIAEQEIPLLYIKNVECNTSIEIETENYPRRKSFIVRMNHMGSRGEGGPRVGIADSGAGGTFSITIPIPEFLSDSEQVAIRLETIDGWSSYNWFYNLPFCNASSSSDEGVQDESDIDPAVEEMPFISIDSVICNTTVTTALENFPVSTDFTVLMRAMDDDADYKDSIVVGNGTVDRREGLNETFSIPDEITNSRQIELQINYGENTITNWFYNVTSEDGC